MNDRNLQSIGGLIISVIGVVLVCWALAPLLWRIAVTLLGLWLIVYGVRMRSGMMPFMYAYSRFSGRSVR